jgi:hypothetical protein
MADKDPSSWKKFLGIGKPAWWDQLMEDPSAMGQRLRDDYLEAFTNYGKSKSLRAQGLPDFSKLSGFDPMKGVPLAEAWLLLGHPNSREYVMDLRRDNPGSAELQNEEKEMQRDFKHWLTNWARSEIEHRPGPDGVIRECVFVLAGNGDETINTTDLDEIPWLLLVDTKFDLYFSENALRLHDEPSKWFYNIRVWRREDWELLVHQRPLESDDHSAKKQKPTGAKRGRRPIDDTEALLEARKLLEQLAPSYEGPKKKLYWEVAEQVSPSAKQTAEPESVTRRIYNKLRSSKTR